MPVGSAGVGGGVRAGDRAAPRRRAGQPASAMLSAPAAPTNGVSAT